MESRSEKAVGGFGGLKLRPCENPLSPIEEAIAIAQADLPHGNYYSEANSAPLRALLAQ
jgi:hypothetical protein